MTATYAVTRVVGVEALEDQLSLTDGPMVSLGRRVRAPAARWVPSWAVVRGASAVRMGTEHTCTEPVAVGFAVAACRAAASCPIAVAPGLGPMVVAPAAAADEGRAGGVPGVGAGGGGPYRHDTTRGSTRGCRR